MDKNYILEMLDKYCCFEELTENNFYELIISPLEDAECFDHWDYASGATKLVLIFKELDYVIKIPFQGYYEYRESHWTTPSANYYNAQDLAEGYYSCNSEDVRARGGVYHDESDEFYEFCGCHNSKNGWDYCLAEAEIYSQGVADNFGSMFAATILLGEVQGYPIYRQEKCVMFSDEYETNRQTKYSKRVSRDYEQINSLKNKGSDFPLLHEVDADWRLDFYLYYGEEVYKDFCEYCYNHNIADLHNGNIGYRKGVPVLVDYSSYYEGH